MTEITKHVRFVLEQKPEKARGTMASIRLIDALKSPSRNLLDAKILLYPDYIQDYLIKDRCAQVVTDPQFSKQLKAFLAARTALMDSSLLKRVNDDTGVRIHRVLQCCGDSRAMGLRIHQK